MFITTKCRGGDEVTWGGVVVPSARIHEGSRAAEPAVPTKEPEVEPRKPATEPNTVPFRPSIPEPERVPLQRPDTTCPVRR